jgi:hypothetical protein
VPIANVVSTPPSCYGGCNGQATVNAVGCVTYSYNYSSGSTPNNQKLVVFAMAHIQSLLLMELMLPALL